MLVAVLLFIVLCFSLHNLVAYTMDMGLVSPGVGAVDREAWWQVFRVAKSSEMTE